MHFKNKIISFCWIFFSLLYCGISGIAYASSVTYLKVNTALAHVNNATLSLTKTDKVSDENIQLSVQALHKNEFKPRHLLSASAQIKTTKYNALSSLDEQSIQVGLGYVWQPYFGFSAPVYNIGLKYLSKTNNTHARDNNTWQINTGVSKRLTHKLTGSLVLQAKISEAQHAVFDNSERSILGQLSYRFNQHTTWFSQIRFAKGDITSINRTTNCQAQMTELYYNADTYAEKKWQDQAMNQLHCGDWWAYRYEANTRLGSIGVNYTLAPTHQITLLLKNISSEVSKNLSYRNNVIKLNYYTYW